MLECPLYDDRKQYIDHYYFRRPSMLKFIELVPSRRKSQVKNLATFIFKAFIARNEYPYRNSWSLAHCSSRAAATCGSRAALKYFVCKLIFRL